MFSENKKEDYLKQSKKNKTYKNLSKNVFHLNIASVLRYGTAFLIS